MTGRLGHSTQKGRVGPRTGISGCDRQAGNGHPRRTWHASRPRPLTAPSTPLNPPPPPLTPLHPLTPHHPQDRHVQGGLLGDGVNSILACLGTSMPNTTFSQNNGIIVLTRCASVMAGFSCALWLLAGEPEAAGGLGLGLARAVGRGVGVGRGHRHTSHLGERHEPRRLAPPTGCPAARQAVLNRGNQAFSLRTLGATAAGVRAHPCLGMTSLPPFRRPVIPALPPAPTQLQLRPLTLRPPCAPGPPPGPPPLRPQSVSLPKSAPSSLPSQTVCLAA